MRRSGCGGGGCGGGYLPFFSLHSSRVVITISTRSCCSSCSCCCGGAGGGRGGGGDIGALSLPDSYQNVLDKAFTNTVTGHCEHVVKLPEEGKLLMKHKNVHLLPANYLLLDDSLQLFKVVSPRVHESADDVAVSVQLVVTLPTEPSVLILQLELTPERFSLDVKILKVHI